MNVGDRLKEVIKENNIVQKELASHIGVGASYISDIIRGKKVPIDTLGMICDYIGISLSEFFLPFSEEGQAKISPQIRSLLEQCKRLSSSQIKLLIDVASNFEQIIPSNIENFSLIPLVGSAAAGSPLNNGTFPEETIMAPSKFGDSSKYFAITVKGDSMSPLIRNGDYAIILYNSVPEPNDIVLIRSDDIADVGYAIKKFKKSGSAYQFISLNPSYPPLTLNPQDVISVEKVVHIIHVSV